MVDLQYISFSTKQSSTQSLFFGPKQCSAGQVNSLYFTNNKSPPPHPWSTSKVPSTAEGSLHASLIFATILGCADSNG